jgi:hypothetical protein
MFPELSADFMHSVFNTGHGIETRLIYKKILKSLGMPEGSVLTVPILTRRAASAWGRNMKPVDEIGKGGGSQRVMGKGGDGI